MCGQVNRYKRKGTGTGTFSTGWEGHRLGETDWFRREAIPSCRHIPGSSFLWSARDLAAWGVAVSPPTTTRTAPSQPPTAGRPHDRAARAPCFAPLPRDLCQLVWPPHAGWCCCESSLQLRVHGCMELANARGEVG